MIEFQTAGVQRLPAKTAQGFHDRLTGAAGQRQATAVDRVADERMAAMREMHRVLARGGFAGFSVWGRFEETPWAWVFNQACREHGVALEIPHEFAHGKDLDQLRERVLAAGYAARITMPAS